MKCDLQSSLVHPGTFEKGSQHQLYAYASALLPNNKSCFSIFFFFFEKRAFNKMPRTQLAGKMTAVGNGCDRPLLSEWAK